MRHITFVLATTVMILLAGCESMSVSECKVADWSRVGYTDGAAGSPSNRIADYAEDCGKAGITPVAGAYRQGWDLGIQRYCTAANGWREGTLGRSGKESVCQGQAGFDGFARYLDAGLKVYRTQEQIQHNNNEMGRLQKELETATKDEDKKRLRGSLKDLDRSQFYLRGTLSQLQSAAP